MKEGIIFLIFGIIFIFSLFLVLLGGISRPPTASIVCTPSDLRCLPEIIENLIFSIEGCTWVYSQAVNCRDYPDSSRCVDGFTFVCGKDLYGNSYDVTDCYVYKDGTKVKELEKGETYRVKGGTTSFWKLKGYKCEEERCEPRWLDEYRCYGSWRQRKYLEEDCDEVWKNWEYCDYGCENGVCLPPPTTTTTTIPQIKGEIYLSIVGVLSLLGGLAILILALKGGV